MTLRGKTLLGIVLVFLALVSILALFLRRSLLDDFEALETREVETHVERARGTLAAELGGLASLVRDWAWWDDSVQFMEDRNDRFVRANLTPTPFIEQRLRLIALLEPNGLAAWARQYEASTGQLLPLPPPLIAHFDPQSPLFAPGPEPRANSGLVVLPNEVLLVAAAPILMSDKSGPSRGWLVMGRALDGALLERWRQQTQLEQGLRRLGRGNAAEGGTPDLVALTSQPTVVHQLDAQNVLGHTLLRDVYGHPAAVLSVQAPRRTYLQGQNAVRYNIASLAIVVVLFSGLTMLFLERLVLAPLARQAQAIRNVRAADNRAARLTAEGSDEIAELARTVNDMLERIDSSQRELVRNEERLHAITEATPDAILLLDDAGRLTFWSAGATRHFGYAANEVLGREWALLLPAQRRGDTPETLRARLEAGQLTAQRRDGTEFPVEGSLTTWPHGGQHAHCLVVRDISVRRQAELERIGLEMRLARAEKMETLGTLAGGVAHDLNNVLGAVVAYPEMLLRRLPEGDALRRPLTTMKASAERAAAIVQDLLTLTRRGVTVAEVVHLNATIGRYLDSREYAKLLEFHPQMTLRTELDPALPNIVGSPLHLTKTVMNLVSNAAEAMPQGGTLTLTTRRERRQTPHEGYELVPEGDYVVLEVADTGVGIAAADLERVFEPFFTKKVMGRSGTGLGMAVVWGTVKDHQGFVDIVSRVGAGSTITLYFPVTRRELRRAPEVAPAETPHGNGETILVVDDVESQREVAAAILRELRYDVHAVASGEEAVAYLRQHRADLLVLDMIMDPGIDGCETYRRLLELHPGQRAILVSGFSETERVHETQRLGAGLYVRKPFTSEKLGVAVHDALHTLPQRSA